MQTEIHFITVQRLPSMRTKPLVRYTLGKHLIKLFLMRPNEIVLPSKSQIRLTLHPSRGIEKQNHPHQTPG